jgi:hypothetical protein
MNGATLPRDAYSTFLFAHTGFWDGAARLLDLGGNLVEFNRSITPEQADAIALRMDWEAASQDMWLGFAEAVEDMSTERPSAEVAPA